MNVHSSLESPGVSMKEMRLVLDQEEHIRLIQTVKRKAYTKIRQMA